MPDDRNQTLSRVSLLTAALVVEAGDPRARTAVYGRIEEESGNGDCWPMRGAVRCVVDPGVETLLPRAHVAERLAGLAA